MTRSASRCREEVGLRDEFTVVGSCVRRTEQPRRRRGQRTRPFGHRESNNRKTREEANKTWKLTDPLKGPSLIHNSPFVFAVYDTHLWRRGSSDNPVFYFDFVCADLYISPVTGVIGAPKPMHQAQLDFALLDTARSEAVSHDFGSRGCQGYGFKSTGTPTNEADFLELA